MNASLPQITEHFDTYLAELRRIPLLTRERERELAIAYRDRRDLAAGRLLVTSNLRFVVRIARQYRTRGRKLADLVQEGNLGLVQAVERFDPDQGVRLISYAVTWIRARMLNQILQSWSLVKIGTTGAQRRLFFSLARTQRELERRLDPGDPEAASKLDTLLATCLGVTPAEVESMRQRLESKDVSLDAPTPRGDDAMVDLLASREAWQDETLSLAQESGLATGRVRAALGCLDERERLVIELRVLEEPTRTLQDVGERLGCGRERARQLEQRAMKKLRACLETCGAKKGCARHCASLRVITPAAGTVPGMPAPGAAPMVLGLGAAQRSGSGKAAAGVREVPSGTALPVLPTAGITTRSSSTP
jgi:RNA polymerase sigma-32 factor